MSEEKIASAEVLFLPRFADGRTGVPVRMGVITMRTPDGGYLAELGQPDQFNWHWDEASKVMRLALVAPEPGGAGAAVPTPVTSGIVRKDGREVVGSLGEVMVVVERAPPGGTTTSAAAKAEPSGTAAIAGRALVATPEGLGRLDSLISTGGLPKSTGDRVGQDGDVPAGINVLGRLSSFRLEGVEHGWAMAIRIPLRKGDPGVGRSSAPGAGRFELRQASAISSAGAAPGEPRPADGAVFWIVQFAEFGDSDGQVTGRIVQQFIGTSVNDIPRLAGVQQNFLNRVAILNNQSQLQQRTIQQLAEIQQEIEQTLRSGEEPTRAQIGRREILRKSLDALNRSLKALGADVGGARGGFMEPESTAEIEAEDATASSATIKPIEVWGDLRPYNEKERRAPEDDEFRGLDPESYAAFTRLAVHILLDQDTLVGDPPPPPPPPPGDGDPPPPKKKKKKPKRGKLGQPPQPPPEDPDPPPKPPPGGGAQERAIFGFPVLTGNDPAKGQVPMARSDTFTAAQHEGIPVIDGDAEDLADLPIFTFTGFGGSVTGITFGQPTGGTTTRTPETPETPPPVDCPMSPEVGQTPQWLDPETDEPAGTTPREGPGGIG